jgi:hypothetical protein
MNTLKENPTAFGAAVFFPFVHLALEAGMKSHYWATPLYVVSLFVVAFMGLIVSIRSKGQHPFNFLNATFFAMPTWTIFFPVTGMDIYPEESKGVSFLALSFLSFVFMATKEDKDYGRLDTVAAYIVVIPVVYTCSLIFAGLMMKWFH